MDNIELHVRNVHIRYEDRTDAMEKPFSIGATLESLEMKSTDEHWKSSFVDLGNALRERLKDPSGRRLPQLFAYKLSNMNKFAVYCQPLDVMSSQKGLGS